MTTTLVFKNQEEFQNHCSQHESQTFVTHNGYVYEVSEFLEDHPGGPAWILEFKSKDISEVFHDDDYHDHSDNALRMLQKYKVGYIKAQEEPTEAKPDEVESYPKITKEKVEYKDFSIDLTRGMVPQVLHLNKKQYMHMIHNSIHLPYCRLFDSDLAESLSRNPWYRIPILWFPIMAILIYFGTTYDYTTHSYADKFLFKGSPDFSVFAVILTLLLGVFVWTLVEYCLHRGIFHFDDKLPDHKWALYAHFLIHGIHHTIPMDPDRLVFPPLLGAGVYLIFFPTVTGLFPGNLGRILLAGLIIGYVAYDMTHIYIHHCTPFIGHFKEMKKYHNKHHYVDGNRGYGITSKLWDKVFRTELL
jgi:4-hydroxysphinganine ceramide fatty acyl 2-hydroxylase